jgi:CsbD-like.
MNKEQFQGSFRELKGKIKEKWGKLTDDEITQINGNFEQLLGKLQQKYGYNKQKAEEELRNWNHTAGEQSNKSSKENREKIKTR